MDKWGYQILTVNLLNSFFKNFGRVEKRNNHKMRKSFALACSSNQIIYCIIPGTSPTQPRVKLTAVPMCIEMDRLFH